MKFLFISKNKNTNETKKEEIETKIIKKNNSFNNSNSENSNSTKGSSVTSSLFCNYNKSKPIQFPFLETDESILRIENISLFDGNKLLKEELYEIFLKDVNEFKQNSTKTNSYFDNHRAEEAYSKGGIEFRNREVLALIRSTAKELLYSLGRKLLSGDFNLTTISVPIKIMIPISILQGLGRSCFQVPYYMHLACQAKDEIEVMKYTIVGSLASLFCSIFFLKPMNPILGETYQALYSDGSKMYMEQTSHHPPVSSFQIYGPNRAWETSGFCRYKSGAGLNSFWLQNNGKRVMKVKEPKMEIDYGFFNDAYNKCFWGNDGKTLHTTAGECIYEEKKLGIKAIIKFDTVKGKPNDYFSGEINYTNKYTGQPQKISILGSYLSYIEFDGVKYWDIRENFPIKLIEINDNLPSSSLIREDRVLLEEEKMEEAQIAKDNLENLQRNDRKLRQKYGSK
jgi:hypothetical protein